MREPSFDLWHPAGEWEILRRFANADFDPVSGTMMALTLVGGAMSAAGTLAAGANAAAMGKAQRQAAEFQATQDTMNSASNIAAAGRQAIELNQRANLVRSSAVAGAAAGGVTTTSGSPLTNEAEIAARGRYGALMELWNGQNAATGDLNKAAAARYTGLVDEIGGQKQKEASQYSAAGTLASSGASAFKVWGRGGSLDPLTNVSGSSLAYG